MSREAKAQGDEECRGAYVHIPFCRYRCDYCAFVTFVGRDHLIEGYVDACATQLRSESWGRKPLSTLYFGGGTPSRLTLDHLSKIIEAATLSADVEISIECNPDDVTEELLCGYRDLGVTRVSFGVQSTSPRALRQLGRPEPVQRVEELASLVQSAQLPSWNFDLIYGAAGETEAEFATTVERIVALQPPHLSAYALTVEPGTPLARTPERYPNEDHQADRYEYLSDVLQARGYVFEEISSWSQPGHQCRHHDLYWTGGDYLGIGSGAHGHDRGRRYWNTVSPERYISAIGSGQSPVVGEEVLDDATRRLERLTLLLRTAHGVPIEAIDFDRVAQLCSPRPLLEVNGDRVVLTVAGRLVANTVVDCLVP